MFYAEKAARATTIKRPTGLITAGIIFLVAWLLVARLSTASLVLGLPNQLQDLITLMLGVILESLPFVVLGILLSIAVQVWLPDKLLMRRLPRNPFLRRICISSLGMFLPVCECGNVPLSRGLMVQGFSVGESLTFLLAAPILNPITIITTQQAFPNDPNILWARLVAGFAIANVVGWLYSKHRSPNSLLAPKFAATCKPSAGADTHGHNHAHSHGHANHNHANNKKRATYTIKKARSFRLFIAEVGNILPALFIGASIAALVQVLVPRDVLYGLGSNPMWSIGIMMLLAFVISICSNVDAFFALAFSNSFTSGSIVSFLVFGPMIDIKMLNLMRTTYKARVLMQITVIVALMSAIAGLVVQYAF